MAYKFQLGKKKLPSGASIDTTAGDIELGTDQVDADDFVLTQGVSGLVKADFTKLAAIDATAAEINYLDNDDLEAADFVKLAAITAGAAELNLLDGVSGLVQSDFTKLAAVDATAAELNLLDGGTAATATTVADADRLVLNDNGTMKQVAMTDFEVYFEGALDTLSNVTTVGALDAGSITSGFGAIDNGTSNITTGGLLKIDIDSAETINSAGGGIGAAGSITLGAGGDAGLYVSSDDMYIENKTSDKDIIFRVNDGGTFTTIAHIDGADGRFQFAAGKLDIGGTAVTADAAELNLLDGVSGLVQSDFTKLAAVDATAAELNIMDGDTAATATTLADADRVVVNDNGTMKQVALTDFEVYFEGALDTLSNVTTVGALNAGSITSGFASIDVGGGAISTTGTVTAGLLDVDDVQINGQTISTDNGNKNLILDPNGTGSVTVPSGYEDRSGIGASSLMPKSYIDGVAQGLDIKASCKLASASASDVANMTYDNTANPPTLSMANAAAQNSLGVFDGVAIGSVVGTRVLIKDFTGASEDHQNGFYELATAPVVDRSKLTITFAGNAGDATDANDGGQINFELNSKFYRIEVDGNGNDASAGFASGSGANSGDPFIMTVGRTGRTIQQLVAEIIGDTTKGLLHTAAGLNGKSEQSFSVTNLNNTAFVLEENASSPRQLNFTNVSTGAASVSNAAQNFAITTRGVLKRASLASGLGGLSDGAEPMTPGSFSFIEQGTENADKGFVMSSDTALAANENATAFVFTQFSGAGSVTLNNIEAGGISLGSVVASKPVTVDANKDISSGNRFRHLRCNMLQESAFIQSVDAASVNVTPSNGSIYIIQFGASNVNQNYTINLPTTADNGKVAGTIIKVKRVEMANNSRTLTVVPGSGVKIDNSTNSVVLAGGDPASGEGMEAVSFICDGTDWFMI